MTTTQTETPTNAASPAWMEQRLDALDRALLGILPRSERLTLVTQVESRIRELSGGNPSAEPMAAAALDQDIAADVVTRRATPAVPKRRSRLALSSGILGIVALAMLFAMPITYFLVVSFGEDFDEFISMGLLGIHVLTVAIGGLVALIMGIAGLVSLSRRKGRLVGHGWAITGLCTAPLPTLVGGLMVLVTAFSLLAVQSVTVESAPSPRGVVNSSSSPSYCASPAATCGPAYIASPAACMPAAAIPPPNFPSSMPMPMSAAPSFGAPAEAYPPLTRAAPPYSDPVQPSAEPSRAAPAALSPQSLPQNETASTELPIHWQPDIDQAMKQAKDEKKLVLVHFYSDSCPPCRAVEQKVYPQPQVVQAMMRNYVPVKINVDEDQKTATRYEVRAIPTDVVLGSDGKETYRGISKQSVTEYTTMLNSVAIPTDRTSYIDDAETSVAGYPPSVAPRLGTVAPAAASVGPYGSAPLPPAPSSNTNRYYSSEPTPVAPTAPASTNPPSNAVPAKAPESTPAVPGNPTESLDPPSDDEVLRALENANPVQGGILFLHEMERNNVRIVKEKIADYVDPPRVVPLIGPVQLHHAHYKCTVYCTQTTRVGWPVAHTLVDEDSQEVVYIDHNHFQMVASADTSAAARH
jgi:thiol-disulfide isomerase/thioredoxin